MTSLFDDFDGQLLRVVSTTQDASLVENLLPLCGATGRKDALKSVVKANNEKLSTLICTYCVEHNDLTPTDITMFLHMAVVACNHPTVKILAPLSAPDFDLIKISLLTKNVDASHILTDAFGFDSECFTLAAQTGWDSVLAQMLPKSNPQDHGEALYQAVRCNHQRCVDLLYDATDADDAKIVVQRLKENFPHYTTQIWDDFKARVARDVLQGSIGDVGSLRTRKM